jgi:glucokinase
VAGKAGSGPLGIAAIQPYAPSADAIIASVKQRYAGSFLQLGLASSGIGAAVGEAWAGAARGVGNVVFFAVAEHAIAGVVRDGAPMFGARRRAASIAWLALNPVEREDYRKIGCLEAEVAAAGIVRRLIWRIKAGDRSRVEDAVGGDLTGITAAHVLNAARDGDGVSISVMRDTAKYLGMAAANLVIVTDPEMLVLGGIMATASDLLSEPVRTELARRLPRQMMEALAIVPAALGDDATAIGAARLATAPLT